MLEPDRGAAHGRRAGREPALPTSGPHLPRLPAADQRPISRDELLHALELGNVVIAHPGDVAPAELTALRDEVAGPYDPALARAGQALLLVPAPAGRQATEALAWRRRLITSDPAQLRSFAEAWLGKGALADSRG